MNDQMSPISDEPKKNNTTLIIAVVAVVLLCCCCLLVIGGWYLGDCFTSPNDPSVCPLASILISSI